MTTSDHKAPTILSNLKEISKYGVSLYLDGKEASPDEIADHCVNDEAVYMPDYVMNDNGSLKEIRYNKVFNH
ncbi:MAG: hypothetical protein FWC09_00540 [Lachnospiraceae bacterium]|nr:hypothetical protein [Lachnospiraceae bacterium]